MVDGRNSKDDMSKIFSAIFFLALTTLAVAQEKPPLSYDNWNVCPFECCTYRDWTADEDIPVHGRRDEKSPVVFQLHRGEVLHGVTGVVVTERPGVIRIDHSVKDGFIDGSDQPQLSLKVGDKIYMLSPLGEGFYLFWYRGKVYHSGIELAAMPGVDGQEAKMTWWKMVRNSYGKIGWTTSNKFNNVDACG